MPSPSPAGPQAQLTETTAQGLQIHIPVSTQAITFPRTASPNTSLQEISTFDNSWTTKTFPEKLWTFKDALTSCSQTLFSSACKARFANSAAFKACLITYPNRAPRLQAVQFLPIDIFYRIKPQTWPAFCIWFLNQESFWKSSTRKKKQLAKVFPSSISTYFNIKKLLLI